MATQKIAPAQSQQKEEVESCRSCLYTGVATCIGLSGYFLHLATEEEEIQQKGKDDIKIRDKSSSQQPSKMNGMHTNGKPTSQSNIPNINKATQLFQSSLKNFIKGTNHTVPKNNRPFLFAMSAVWAVAGAYRLYLN